MFTKKNSPEVLSKPQNQNTPATRSPSSVATPSDSSVARGTKTRIIVNFDVGFSNTLYIRGKGANLSWNKGIPLKNVKADEWVWENDSTFPSGEFKILINDKTYEVGQNHALICGSTLRYTPKF